MSIDLTVVVPAFSRIVCAAVADSVAELDRVSLESLLRDVRFVTGAVESVRLAAVHQLDTLADRMGTFDPEATVAGHGRTSRREAATTSRRARTAEQMPPVKEALAQGEISLEHVDAVASALAQLEPDERGLLADQAEWIAGCARRCTPQELLDVLRVRARQLSADDGLARFARQQRASTLRMWTDPVTGMMKLFGEFDPELGAALIHAVQSAADSLAAGELPPTCPTDDRKHGHLRALALAQLVTGSRRTGPADPLFTVVIDLKTISEGPHLASHIDVTGGVELPIDTLRRLACVANIVPVVLDGNGVALDVGRAKRFATVAQRHALRAMYRTCAVPGCRVAFDRTTIHHLQPWYPSGATDLGNLLPLCSHHHHCAHEGRWRLYLDPTDRTLTITLPDGTIMSNAPPFAQSA